MSPGRGEQKTCIALRMHYDLAVPVSVSFEPPAQFVVRSAGDVTESEVMGAISEMLGHPAMSGRTTALVITKDVTSAPSGSELRAIAVATKQLVDRGVTAIAFVTDSAFVYGVARMFAAYAELADIRTRVFLDLGDAREWLAESTGVLR